MESKENNLEEAINYHKQEKYSEAKILYLDFIKKKPDSFKAFYLLGALELQLNNFKDSIFFTFQAIKFNPSYPGSYNNIGLGYQKIFEYKKSIKFLTKAVKLNPKYYQAYSNLGNSYKKMNKFFQAKTAFENSIKINPNYSEAYNNLSALLIEQNNYSEAKKYLDKAIKVNPLNYEALKNRAELSFILKNYKFAIEDLEKAFNINSKFDLDFECHLRLKIADWNNLKIKKRHLLKNFLKERKGRPWLFLSLFDAPYIQKICAKNFIEKNIRDEIPLFSINKKNKKLKIGYISSDFYNHATMQLFMDVLKHHDQKKFNIDCLKLNKKNDKISKEISLLSRVLEMSKNTLDEIQKKILKNKYDILVDLKGYTRNSRYEIFYKKLAPIYINYLGYPGTLGNKNFDYIIADRFLIPERFEKFYNEKIIYLPKFYQPSCDMSYLLSKNITRDRFGLPKNKFLFCSLNNPYKINPLIFKAWIKILNSTKNSYLVLLEEDINQKKNLLSFVSEKNFDITRIIFLKKTSRKIHLERMKLMNLFLDTFPCCAHTTANECLQVNLPILSLVGKSFASRVSGSLSNALGLNNLITDNVKDYVDKAIFLNKNANKLSEIKKK